MGGNQEILDEIIRTMIVRFPEEINKIRDAVSLKDFDTITRAAHTLKSGLKSIDAGPLLDCVKQMESAGKSKDISRCRESAG
jgi:HPt (histidine-containing phosphotransfer) domain-containing protein